MKILCVSDYIDPFVYSVNAKERFRDIDIILGAGDLPVSYYEFIVSATNKPLYFIFGNHNLKRLFLFRPDRAEPPPLCKYRKNILGEYEFSMGSSYIGNKIIHDRKNDLIIGGLGGSYKYNKGPNQHTETSMILQIAAMIPQMIINRIFKGRYIDILLTHAPPYEINDRKDRCHRGFKAFRWFIRRFKPKFLLHGHIHLYDLCCPRESVYKDTRVINCYKSFLLNYPGNEEK